MVEEKEKKTSQDAFLPPVLYWDELKAETKSYLSTHIKRYIPFLGISFLFFLITLTSLLPICIFQNRIEVYILSLLFCILLTIFLFAPSILAFIDLIVIDSMHEMNQQPLPNKKGLIKNYFNGFYMWILKILHRNTRVLGIIFKTFFVYILLFLIVILPSHFFKISAEPQYLGLFNGIKDMFKMNNIYEGIKHILELSKFFKIELLIINLLTVLFFVIYSMYSFYFILFRTSTLAFKYRVGDCKHITRIAFMKNKWSFAAFFVNSFKFYILIFIGLLAIFSVLYYFTVDNYFVVFLLTYSCSITGLFIVVPFFIKQMTDINLSFTDIYLEGTMIYLNKVLENPNIDNKETIELEIKKLSGLVRVLKQDRKTIYQKLKQIKKVPPTSTTNEEELAQKDEVLEKYFKDVEEEIKNIMDD